MRKWEDAWKTLDELLDAHAEEIDTRGHFAGWCESARQYHSSFVHLVKQVGASQISDPATANSAITPFKNGIRVLIHESTSDGDRFDVLIRTDRERIQHADRVLVTSTLAILIALVAAGVLHFWSQRGMRLWREVSVLESANRTKSEFLANMSHEVRTPLTAILGFADNLLDEELSEAEKVNCVHTIRRNGGYLLNVINDILDLSKIETGKSTVEYTDCRVAALIRDVASLMQPQANDKGVSLGVELVGAIPETVQTDTVRLRQVLINLIGNAIKFTDVGSVRLVTRFVCDGVKPYLQFDVIDTGCGITEQQKGNLFHPFTQGDTSTTRKFGGTGLGLAICKYFSERLGGSLELVATEVGLGPTFRATIAPKLLDDAKMVMDSLQMSTEVHPAAAAPEVPKASLRGSRLQGYRILVAEDGPDNQRLIEFILKNAGADVTVKENGQLALEAAIKARNERRPFHVILMDMQMPVMDGYDATAHLRQREYTGSLIALTSHAMAGDRQKCIDAGCDAYATKPIDRAELISLIQSQVSMRDTGSRELLQCT